VSCLTGFRIIAVERPAPAEEQHLDAVCALALAPLARFPGRAATTIGAPVEDQGEHDLPAHRLVARAFLRQVLAAPNDQKL
jgi:hypothetical protein